MFEYIKNKYIYFIVLQLLLGFLAVIFPFITKILSPLIVVLGVMVILKNKDKGYEALFFSAYVCGIEVFLRMTDGAFFNEYAKYTISLFCFLGVLFHAVRSEKLIFIFLFFLLIPGVFIGMLESSFNVELRKTIMFNISGEFCLLMACLYTINLQISYSKLLDLVYVIGLPTLSIVSYIIYRTPTDAEIFSSTGSNFIVSGGFGPNQVATILGLGAFCFFALFFLRQNSKLEKIIYSSLVFILLYRGIITFSRGGIITAFVMIIVLLSYMYFYSNVKTKFRILVFAILGFIAILFLWTFTSHQTDGLIVKRYNNQDALGREKAELLTGREVLIETEIDQFLENPIFGVGVGRNKELRYEETGINAASHNEISRLMAEHGVFGIIYLLILIAIPLLLWFNNKQHIFLFSFFLFWALTINHAAMRTVSPSFIFALCLLKVYIPNTKNENIIHR